MPFKSKKARGVWFWTVRDVTSRIFDLNKVALIKFLW